MLGEAQVCAVVPVRDMETSRRFYVDTLGCHFVGEHGGAGMELSTRNGSLFLYESPYAGQAQHTIVTFAVDDLESNMDDLRSAGVTFEEYQDVNGVTTVDGIATMGEEQAAWFQDPDGNIIGLAHSALVRA